MTLNSTTFPLGTAVENSNKVNISYFKQVKNFCALLINLHRSGSVDEKSLCPLVVAILGDMIGVAPNSGICCLFICIIIIIINYLFFLNRKIKNERICF